MRNLLIVSGILCIWMSAAFAQDCKPEVSNGQNLVRNGDFSQSYSQWAHDVSYVEYTPCNGCYSVPGRIYAGKSPALFNQAFSTPIIDHSPSSDNMFLMVDGICQLGINLWEQNNIPIAPNTNYFFSVWITSLKAEAPYGTLRFNINGVSLPTTITAPPAVGAWVRYTAIWNSGSNPPAAISISIQNTTVTGCDHAVDFAVDDISFTPGCEFGSPGPIPNLGPDFSICGKAVPFNINPNFSAATAASSEVHYRWFKDGVQLLSGAGSSFYNLSVSEPGTYYVCVDSGGSCVKSDAINITKDYTIDLGPDRDLCTPTTIVLDAGYSGPGVTYQWSKDGSVVAGATNKTLSVTVAGDYSVTVNDPVCGMETDHVRVTTSTATPVDSTFCPLARGGKGTTTLSVIGSGKYKWFTDPVGGTAVGTGNTFVTPALTSPGPHTYYVEDTSTFSLKVGPPALGNGFTNVTNVTAGTASSTKDMLIFNALTDFRLDSLTVFPYNYHCPTPATGNPVVINLAVYNAAGAVVGTSSYTTPCTAEGQPAPPVRVPVGISIPQGNGYQLRLAAGSSEIALYLNTTGSNGVPPSPELYHYPASYASAVEIVSNSSRDFNLYYSPDAFPGYFDWRISRGNNCDRVPVTAYLKCPPCTTSVIPASATADFTKFCEGSISQITLSATGGKGDTLVWFSGQCGGTQVGYSTTGADIVVPAPTAPATYYVRWQSRFECYSDCRDVSVTPVKHPTQADAGTDKSLCNDSSLAVSGNVPVDGAGEWSVISGTASLDDPSKPSVLVKGINAGDLTLRWTVSNSPCPESFDEMTIHRDTLSKPVIMGLSFDTCANTTNLLYSTKNNNAPKTTYAWASTGTININSVNANAVNIDIGSLGGKLKVTETYGVCNLSGDTTISIAPNVSDPDAGKDRFPCVDMSPLFAVHPAIGTGHWEVAGGTGVFDDKFDPKTMVTGLSSGKNTFVWVVEGCGGPLYDTVNLTVNPSDMLVDLTGPEDTLCIQTARLLAASVTGGSGDFTYYWGSSDKSFAAAVHDTLHRVETMTVYPVSGITTYYVYVKDNFNYGCQSLLDSAIIYSIESQPLWIANLITPNDDGKNDALIVKDALTGKTPLPGTDLEVYNRWGALVYQAKSYDNTWKALEQPAGVYYYHLKSSCGGWVYKGWVQVVPGLEPVQK